MDLIGKFEFQGCQTTRRHTSKFHTRSSYNARPSAEKLWSTACACKIYGALCGAIFAVAPASAVFVRTPAVEDPTRRVRDSRDRQLEGPYERGSRAQVQTSCSTRRAVFRAPMSTPPFGAQVFDILQCPLEHQRVLDHPLAACVRRSLGWRGGVFVGGFLPASPSQVQRLFRPLTPRR